MYQGEVIKNLPVSQNIYLLKIKTDLDLIVRFNPGQFVKIKINERIDPLIPRPFTIHDVRKNSFYVLYQVVGKGTKALSLVQPGSKIEFLGPLGNPFPKLENYVLCAGGIGIAGFIYLIESIKRKTHPYVLPKKIFYGARTAEDLVCYPFLKDMRSKVQVATEDGSKGYKGFITELLQKYLTKDKADILACGPLPMLKAVAKITQDFGVKAYLTMETFLSCGTGFCKGCVIPLKNGNYVHLCVDGPTLLAEEIDFEAIS
ncbi:dihydroorotate dehydrogenase electron transfer subunit [Thermodesulfobacterium sp. TA1]|uniref:dihydroorotate dehydrogenase electron transfer subunit n=1 Tax=Thermodesulfobacterium sp. TA1 TaxID=2234087 RepID=UPI001231C250|nr:dihydroorotate dehydrogenase electron transfer subunit [Thermodesulfobacterium sp. TA1]QER42487.1 dihydroorotate dehydrogenase electron transfer subunit [Thermodesulfobacterium sp. TA1]